MAKIKNVLWFGCGNAIGDAICRKLSESHYDVVATYHNALPKNAPYHVEYCNVTDVSDIDRIFKLYQNPHIVGTTCFPWMEGDPFDWNNYAAALAFFNGHMDIMLNAAQSQNNVRMVNLLGQGIRHGIPSAAHYIAFFAALKTYGDSINGHPDYGMIQKMNVLSVMSAAVRTPAFEKYSEATKARYEDRMSQVIEVDALAEQVVFQIGAKQMLGELVMDNSFLIGSRNKKK